MCSQHPITILFFFFVSSQKGVGRRENLIEYTFLLLPFFGGREDKERRKEGKKERRKEGKKESRKEGKKERRKEGKKERKEKEEPKENDRKGTKRKECKKAILMFVV
jgi:hypothetical protein